MTKPKFMTHRLSGIAAQAYDDKPFWVLDIETGIPGDSDTLGGRLVCAQMRFSDDKHTPYWFYDESSLLDFILSKPCRGCKIYAHNGAGYDYLYVIKYLLTHKEEFSGVECNYLMRGDGRVICATLTKNKHAVKLLDTFHVFPKSLKSFTEMFAPEYVKKDRTWKNDDGSFNWFDPTLPDDREYLDYDCLGLIEAIDKFRYLLHKTFGINMSMTAAGTAMKAWRVTLKKDDAYWRCSRERVEDFIRQSYCGGYVFLTTTKRLYDRAHIDINAAYADAMRKGVPSGVAAGTLSYRTGYPGFYRVIAYCPDNEQYPIVPLKRATGVVYPVGEHFETIIPSCTYEYALSIGYTFTILEGYVFDEIVYPFDTFLDRCQQLELDHEGTPIKEVAKLLRNSLYGKFGMNKHTERIVYTDNPKELAEPLMDKVTGEIIDDFYVEEEELSAAYMQIQWASWITAQTRIRTHQIARAGQASYGDTDSADMSVEACQTLIDRGDIVIGKRYGEIKIEHGFAWFEAHAPKDYVGYLADKEWESYAKKEHAKFLAGKRQKDVGEKERYVHRAKSMPRDKITVAEHIAAPVANVQKEYQSVISFSGLVKKPDAPLVIPRKRSYSTLKNSASWQEMPDGHVRSKRIGVLSP